MTYFDFGYLRIAGKFGCFCIIVLATFAALVAAVLFWMP